MADQQPDPIDELADQWADRVPEYASPERIKCWGGFRAGVNAALRAVRDCDPDALRAIGVHSGLDCNDPYCPHLN